MIDYAFICLGLVGFAILMYVILDGFDLGVGILFPFFNAREQETALKAIAPMWDGNETWLVLGGALLYACFPTAYSTLLPALYMPLMLMLCALVGRGVAFEFRAKAVLSKKLWARVFFIASLFATFCQGCLLGTYIQISHQSMDLSMHGGLIWFTPFVVFCGVGLCFGYALLGAGWLVSKTTGSIQGICRHLATHLYTSAFIILAGITIITPLVNPAIADRWFSGAVYYLMPLPVLSFIVLVYAFYHTHRGHDYWPFFGAVFMFVGCFAGLAFSVYPNLLPGQPYQTLAAYHSSLKMMVFACAVLLPMLISYSAYAYWVFRGKVDEDAPFYH